jgi:hypothetical protein
MFLFIMSVFIVYNENFSPTRSLEDGEATHLRCQSILQMYQNNIKMQSLNFLEKDICSFELYTILPQYA